MFTPQIDENMVNVVFNELNIPQEKDERKYYTVEIQVRMSDHPLVFTSATKSEAYIFNKNPKLLTADQIVSRFTYPKEQCVKAEMEQKVIDEQQCCIDAAVNFIRNSTKPTRIVVIEGPNNSGKSFIAQ